MPWKVVNGTGKKPWKIVKKTTGETVGSSSSKSKALASVRARYAHLGPEDEAAVRRRRFHAGIMRGIS